MSAVGWMLPQTSTIDRISNRVDSVQAGRDGFRDLPRYRFMMLAIEFGVPVQNAVTLTNDCI